MESSHFQVIICVACLTEKLYGISGLAIKYVHDINHFLGLNGNVKKFLNGKFHGCRF